MPIQLEYKSSLMLFEHGQFAFWRWHTTGYAFLEYSGTYGYDAVVCMVNYLSIHSKSLLHKVYTCYSCGLGMEVLNGNSVIA